MNIIRGRFPESGYNLKKIRLNLHIDLTPMVDVAMLLLTFFMLTAVFNKPQVIELNLPKNPNDSVPVPIFKILNIFVDEHSQLYTSRGAEKSLQPIESSQLCHELISTKKRVPDLITLIKLDRKARYERLTFILDQLSMSDVNKFSILPLTSEDKTGLDNSSYAAQALH
jgi:biopolymer transport protein ExbD